MGHKPKCAVDFGGEYRQKECVQVDKMQQETVESNFGWIHL